MLFRDISGLKNGGRGSAGYPAEDNFGGQPAGAYRLIRVLLG